MGRVINTFRLVSESERKRLVEIIKNEAAKHEICLGLPARAQVASPLKETQSQ